MANNNKIFILAVCIAAITAIFCGICVSAAYADNADIDTDFSVERQSVNVPILMYHNVIDDKSAPNRYEVTERMLRNDIKALKDNGYTPISADMLIAYVKGARIAMPEKPVMLTFDDGFYNYNKLLMPILKEENVNALIAVVGEFTKFNKNTNAVPRYTYVDYSDIKELNDSGNVIIANHSNKFHHDKPRKGVLPMWKETEDSYAQSFGTDTEEMETNLSKIGIKPYIYVYPYGLYCKESERILSDKGYVMTLTCEERVNKVIRGDMKTLKLLGRYNRSGINGTMDEYIKKFESGKK